MSGGGQTHRIEVSIEARPSRKRMSSWTLGPRCLRDCPPCGHPTVLQPPNVFTEDDTGHLHVLRDLNVPVIPRPQGPSDELAFCAGPRKAEDRLANLLEESA